MIFFYCIIMLLLVSYHRRLRTKLLALELYVEGIRVNHSWCMCVAGYGYGGFGGGRAGGGEWHECEIEARRLDGCREMPEHFPSAR